MLWSSSIYQKSWGHLPFTKNSWGCLPFTNKNVVLFNLQKVEVVFHLQKIEVVFHLQQIWGCLPKCLRNQIEVVFHSKNVEVVFHLPNNIEPELGLSLAKIMMIYDKGKSAQVVPVICLYLGPGRSVTVASTPLHYSLLCWK
jgi:hypothetical protein